MWGLLLFIPRSRAAFALQVSITFVDNLNRIVSSAEKKKYHVSSYVMTSRNEYLIIRESESLPPATLCQRVELIQFAFRESPSRSFFWTIFPTRFSHATFRLFRANYFNFSSNTILKSFHALRKVDFWSRWPMKFVISIQSRYQPSNGFNSVFNIEYSQFFFEKG